MHLLSPLVMELLQEDVTQAGAKGGVALSPALARLAARERYLASELQGRRYDIGAKYVCSPLSWPWVWMERNAARFLPA
jgi:UTP--glucose-1-phosphate uridylyltransferase